MVVDVPTPISPSTLSPQHPGGTRHRRSRTARKRRTRSRTYRRSNRPAPMYTVWTGSRSRSTGGTRCRSRCCRPGTRWSRDSRRSSCKARGSSPACRPGCSRSRCPCRTATPASGWSSTRCCCSCTRPRAPRTPRPTRPRTMHASSELPRVPSRLRASRVRAISVRVRYRRRPAARCYARLSPVVIHGRPNLQRSCGVGISSSTQSPRALSVRSRWLRRMKRLRTPRRR